jgi:hypothetical protein
MESTHEYMHRPKLGLSLPMQTANPGEELF